MFYGRVPYFLSNDAKNGIGGTNECMYVCKSQIMVTYFGPTVYQYSYLCKNLFQGQNSKRYKQNH